MFKYIGIFTTNKEWILKEHSENIGVYYFYIKNESEIDKLVNMCVLDDYYIYKDNKIILLDDYNEEDVSDTFKKLNI